MIIFSKSFDITISFVFSFLKEKIDH